MRVRLIALAAALIGCSRAEGPIRLASDDAKVEIEVAPFSMTVLSRDGRRLGDWDATVEPAIPLRVRTQAHGQSARDNFKYAAKRIARGFRRVDLLHDAFRRVRIEHAHR